MRPKVYLDNAATTRIDDRVLNSMLAYYTDMYGNASSMHGFGASAKEALWNSKTTIAASINANPGEILFTSSGTEANNLVLKGIVKAYKAKGSHIIISEIEHDSILNTARFLEQNGCTVTYLPVNSSGLIETDLLEKHIRRDTILVSVMHANNEIGTIQPLAEIGSICRSNNVFFHSDACQSFGKIEIDTVAQNVDLLTLNAHKIYGPKGIGALFIRNGIAVAPELHGGGQENGKRSSTENIPAIVGFATAAQLCLSEMQSESKRIASLRDLLVTYLQEHFENVYFNGSLEQRLVQNLNFSFHGMEGETIRLLLLLDEMGIAVSAGSACSSNDKSNNASHVLQAIGLNQFEARGAIRISLGRYNTIDDVIQFNNALSVVVGQLNSIFS